MAKVHVIARFVAHEGKENQLKGLLQGMLAPTRAESGCESYELYESDSSALGRHLGTPHFERFKEIGAELVKEPFEVNLVKEILTGAAAA
jgi:quinol monooxygenase YgiN